MARVTASVVFADGDSVQIVAQGASSYPDALAQLRHEAVEGVREILEVVRYDDSDDLLDEAERLAAEIEQGDES